MDKRFGATLRRDQGYYNVRELADAISVNVWTIYDWIKVGFIKKPRLQLGRRKYYSTKDVEEIKRQFKKGHK